MRLRNRVIFTFLLLFMGLLILDSKMVEASANHDQDSNEARCLNKQAQELPDHSQYNPLRVPTKTNLTAGIYELVICRKWCFDLARVEPKLKQPVFGFLVEYGTKEVPPDSAGYQFECIKDSCNGKGKTFEIRMSGPNEFVSWPGEKQCRYRFRSVK